VRDDVGRAASPVGDFLTTRGFEEVGKKMEGRREGGREGGIKPRACRRENTRGSDKASLG
jgi:hypothetical protein